MYTGGRLAIYHKNKYTEEKKTVNISYSNFFHCLSLNSPLKLFYHSFHTLVSRECRDILSYARQIPNAKKENIKAVFTVFILLFHCYSKLLGRSKKNSFSKWYTCQQYAGELRLFRFCIISRFKCNGHYIMTALYFQNSERSFIKTIMRVS